MRIKKFILVVCIVLACCMYMGWDKIQEARLKWDLKRAEDKYASLEKEFDENRLYGQSEETMRDVKYQMEFTKRQMELVLRMSLMKSEVMRLRKEVNDSD